MVAGEITPVPPDSTSMPSGITSDSPGPEEFFTPAGSPENYVGELICLKVKDVLGITPVCGAHTFAYTPFATFGDLINGVSTQFQISPGDFELVYQSKTDLYELTQMPLTETLSAADLLPSREKEYSISINSKKRGRKAKARGGRKLDIAFEAAAENTQNEKQAATISSDSNNDTTTSGIEPGIIKRDFVGLKNMNMTCYLNSLLQGLWFTPEFRNLIYVYIHNPKRCSKKSICVPLQKLFLRLQFSIRESIETDELTNTFGWNNRDTWHQHDIEELCNLLMENLSMEFKGTPLEGMIEALFFGTFNDYVKCLECQRSNMRDAAFLVLPLPIRQIGVPLENPTLEEALKTFTTPELLDGNNQYNCSPCDKPCDAHKGFLFKKLPYILTIQLKRFEFNWNTGRRYKLNDKVIFPMVLDMNSYMDKNSVSPSSDLKAELVKPCTEVTTPRSSHSRSTIVFPQISDPNQAATDGNESTQIHIGSSSDAIKERLNEVYRTSGPDVYQLYGVLVHRGGLTGGHYFAYIRDFETATWYRCDDSYVRKADVEDIEISFGGDEEDKEPTSAYMLMYRRYDPEMNVLPFLFQEMPNHIQNLWTSMEELERLAHEEEELEKNTIKMSVHFRIKGSWDLIDSEMYIPKSSTTAHAAYLIHRHFFPNSPELPNDRLRLSRFDKDFGIIEYSFEGYDDQYVTYTLRNPLPTTKNEGLILEIRDQDERFFSYRPSDLIFVTQTVDYKTEEIVRVDEVHASITDTVAKLKHTIGEKLHLPKETLTVILQSTGEFVPDALEVDWSVLQELDVTKINYLYVQSVPPEEIHGLVTFVDNYMHTIIFTLEVQLPVQEESESLPLSVKAMAITTPESAPEKIDPSTEINNGMLEVSQPPKDTTVPSPKEICSTNVNGCTEETVPEPKDDTVEIQNPELLTGGQANIIEISKAMSAPTEQNGSVISNTMPFQPSRKYILKLKDERRSGEWRNCLVRADGRMPLSSFSANISQVMNVAEKDFILYRVDKEDEVELLRLNECFNMLLPFEKIRIRLGHRLQKDEGRVFLYLLDLNYPTENYTIVLGEVAMNVNMTVQEAKAFVFEQCRETLGDIDLSRLRLRKRKDGTPSRIFRENGKVSDYFNFVTIHGAQIYVQKLEREEPIEDQCYPVLIRRWHPSDFMLDLPYEIIIFHDHSVNLERVILDKLREGIDLPENDIEVARPDGNYPYAMNPIAIQDLLWFPLTSNAKKALYVYNDELALFVRDKTETTKAISAEEENTLRLENEKSPSTHYTSSYGLSPPKKETGLKMNLARSPP